MDLSAHNRAWYVTGNQQNAACDGDGDEDVSVESTMGIQGGPLPSLGRQSRDGLWSNSQSSSLNFLIGETASDRNISLFLLLSC